MCQIVANFKRFVDLLYQRDEVQIDDEDLLKFLDMFPMKRRFTVKDFTEELVRWMKVQNILGDHRKTVEFLCVPSCLFGKRLGDEDTETIAMSVTRELQRKVVAYTKEDAVHSWVREIGFALGVKVSP